MKAAAEGAAAEAAHAEALAPLFARLAGHVSTLCAAACVSRAWRAAAAAPHLWSRLHRLRSTTCASRLTDDLLLSLVYRSQGALERIDLTCCFRVTDAGLAAALQHAPALEYLAVVRCPSLTAAGVARALRGRRLQELHVRGISAAVDESTPLNTWRSHEEDDEMDDQRWKSYGFDEPDVSRCLERLQDCVRYEGVLDAVAVCGGTRFSACVGGITSAADDRSEDWETRCGLLCSSGDLTCCDCVEHRCAYCASALAFETAPAPPGRRCSTCHEMVCSVCLEDALPGSSSYRLRRGRAEVCACCSKVRCANCVDSYNKPSERSVLCGGGCSRTLCGGCVTASRVATCKAAAKFANTMGQAPRHAGRDCLGVLCDHCVGGRNSRECVSCGCTVCAGCMRNLPNVMTYLHPCAA